VTLHAASTIGPGQAAINEQVVEARVGIGLADAG
jgi:hypothetical protein